MKMNFKIGEQVRYCHSFLKSINADRDIADLTGIIQSIKQVGSKQLIKVLWNDGELQNALASNLAHMNYDITE